MSPFVLKELSEKVGDFLRTIEMLEDYQEDTGIDMDDCIKQILTRMRNYLNDQIDYFKEE